MCASNGQNHNRHIILNILARCIHVPSGISHSNRKKSLTAVKVHIYKYLMQAFYHSIEADLSRTMIASNLHSCCFCAHLVASWHQGSNYLKLTEELYIHKVVFGHCLMVSVDSYQTFWGGYLT